MYEIWMTTEDLEGYYAFSNYGRIYNYKKQEYSTGNLNKKTGYYEKLLFKDGKYFKGGGIHKFIYEAFKGKIPKGMEINHIDCDKSNNAIWNLSLVSHSQNRKWNTKKVYQFTIEGVLIGEYNSALDASEKTGIKLSIIHSALKQCSGKKYLWSYSNDISLIKNKIQEYNDRWKELKIPVIQLTKDGRFIAEYPSMLEAERQTGILHSSISHCCCGKLKSAGGSVWKYKEVA